MESLLAMNYAMNYRLALPSLPRTNHACRRPLAHPPSTLPGPVLLTVTRWCGYSSLARAFFECHGPQGDCRMAHQSSLRSIALLGLLAALAASATLLSASAAAPMPGRSLSTPSL